MGILGIFKRKKESGSRIDRRSHLLRHGRLTEGTILDIETDEEGNEVVYYVYSVHGVDFESSEFLTDEQRGDRAKYSPGSKVSIRFDQRSHGNSIIE